MVEEAQQRLCECWGPGVREGAEAETAGGLSGTQGAWGQVTLPSQSWLGLEDA